MPMTAAVDAVSIIDELNWLVAKLKPAQLLRQEDSGNLAHGESDKKSPIRSEPPSVAKKNKIEES